MDVQCINLELFLLVASKPIFYTGFSAALVISRAGDIFRETFLSQTLHLDKAFSPGFHKASQYSCLHATGHSCCSCWCSLLESPVCRIHHLPQELEAETHPASLWRCSSPWAEVEDAVLSPLHLLQGLVNADGDVVVLPFAHHEFHIFAVKPLATTESLQVNCRGAREAGWHPRITQTLEKGGLQSVFIKHFSPNSAESGRGKTQGWGQPGEEGWGGLGNIAEKQGRHISSKQGLNNR